jgi:hypothetical protein
LQEFATAVEQLAHSAYTALPEDNIRMEVGKAFADGVEDPCQKNSSAAWKTENDKRGSQASSAVFLAARSQKASARTFWGSR